MGDFIDVSIVTDTPTIADTALGRLAANLQAMGVSGYTPNEGNLEVILLNIVASMASDLALQASQVPQAIFRTFGTQLLGLPYNEGAAATATSTWTLTDTIGHTIAGGTQVTIGGYGFYVETDVIVAGGTNTATVFLIAVTPGSAYNGLSGTAQLVDALAWVSSVAITSPSSGGADQETDPEFAARLSAQLALQAPRPITASDYASFSLAAPESTIGAALGRATAIDGYNPGATNFTGTTNGTTTVTAVSSFTGVTVGSIITAADIPANTTVVAINVGASQLTLSQAATGSNSAESMTATGSYSNERTITVFVTDPNGNALASPVMASLQSWLEGFREVNFLVFVEPPTYTQIYVTYEIHVLPGYVPASVINNVDTALTQYLNPLTWANPLVSAGTGSSAWANPTLGFNIVRWNSLIGVIENVPGVDYVPSGGLLIGTTASPSGTTDLTLPGPAPLPLSDLTTPTIVGSSV